MKSKIGNNYNSCLLKERCTTLMMLYSNEDRKKNKYIRKDGIFASKHENTYFEYIICF